MHIQLMDFGGALSRGEKLSLNFKQEKKNEKEKEKDWDKHLGDVFF